MCVCVCVSVCVCVCVCTCVSIATMPYVNQPFCSPPPADSRNSIINAVTVTQSQLHCLPSCSPEPATKALHTCKEVESAESDGHPHIHNSIASAQT